jgi:hypothetical protein
VMGNGAGIGVLLLASLVGAGCSSQERAADGGSTTGADATAINSGMGGSGTGGAPVVVSADAGQVTCALPVGGPIPAGTCTSVVTRCASVPNNCLGAQLRATIAPALNPCGIWCGELEVGFSAGCATTVVNIYGSDQAAADCLRDVLMQSRFDCVPADGWQRLNLGSCTLP